MYLGLGGERLEDKETITILHEGKIKVDPKGTYTLDVTDVTT